MVFLLSLSKQTIVCINNFLKSKFVHLKNMRRKPKTADLINTCKLQRNELIDLLVDFFFMLLCCHQSFWIIAAFSNGNRYAKLGEKKVLDFKLNDLLFILSKWIRGQRLIDSHTKSNQLGIRRRIGFIFFDFGNGFSAASAHFICPNVK